MQDLANIFIKSIFIDNMVFAYFLGMCSYLAVSKTALKIAILVVASKLYWGPGKPRGILLKNELRVL